MVTRVLLLLTVVLMPALVPAYNHDKQDSNAKAPWNVTWTDALKRTLLAGYDKFARPSHHKSTINVSLSITINHLELDDISGIMTLHGWIKMAWNDDKLKWNSSEYGGLGTIHVGDHEIWQPDIIQYNSASGSQVDQYGNTHCLVSEDGSVLWVPPTKLTTFCNIDLTRWPSDEQTCAFVFGSWTYDVIQINIDAGQPVSDDISVESHHDRGEWDLVKVTHERHEKVYECCENAYVSIHYDVTVKRKGAGGALAILVRAPVAVAVLLALLSHCLPPGAPMAARLLLSVTSPSILALSLLYFSHRLPASETTPDVVMLYSLSLYSVCVSAVISIIVINMALVRTALPWAVKRALWWIAARCVRLPKMNEHPPGEELQGTTVGASSGANAEEGARILSETSTPGGDWLALATAIDRIFFVILLVVIIIIAIVYGC